VADPVSSEAGLAVDEPSHRATPAEPAVRAEDSIQTAPAATRRESAADEESMVEKAPSHVGPTPSTDSEVAEMASEMLARMVELMGFTGVVSSEWRDADAITDERHLLLSVDGSDLSPLIGRRGDTLENIQYLLRLMVNQRLHRWLNIIVDVEQYRAKRQDHLTHLAMRMADQVSETGRSFALEPMPPNERRIVHLALRDHELVYTESAGDGERRKVIIFPKK
jgi:spoIIIJ-associated protein